MTFSLNMRRCGKAPSEFERHFERMPRTSALPPISDAFLSRSKRRLGRLLEVTSDPVDLIAGSTELPATGFRLTALATEATHRVTGVASFILLTNIGDQNLRALHLDFEGSYQCVFCVNDNVFRFPLKFKADRELHLCSPHAMFKKYHN